MPNPPPFVPLDHWRRRTHQLAEGLLQRVDELSVWDYPAATATHVIEFLQDFLRVVGAEVEKAGSEDRLRIFSSLVEELAVFLEWLDNAHIGQTPRSLVQVLEDLIRRMEPNSRVIARPQAEYNYSISDLDVGLKNLVVQFVPKSKQGGFQRFLECPIKLISFPRIDRDNLLSHAIFGHELGHPVATAFLDKEAQGDKHKTDQTKVQQVISEFLEQSPTTAALSDEAKLQRKTRIFKRVLEVRKRALEELISDAVGIMIFGPSALFSMFELLWSGNWDAKPESDDWYPPSRMRIRLMLERLDDLSWPQALTGLAEDAISKPYISTGQSFIQEARNLALTKTDDTVIEEDPILKIAYDWMRSGLVEAVNYAQTNTEQVRLSVSDTVSVLPQLLRRLELGVPPNEVGDPSNPNTVDHRAALLAAWLFKLRGISPDTGKPLSNEEVNRLYQRTMRAVEYVILQNEYKEYLEKANKGGP
jgi:hypothetical protein